VEGWPWPWRAWRALAGKRHRQARPVRVRERSRAEQHGALWQREEKWSTEEASCDRRRGVRTDGAVANLSTVTTLGEERATRVA